MTLVEIIGNQHLRILALEETVGQLQAANSKLQERVMQLTPKYPQGLPEATTGSEITGVGCHEEEPR